jgi:hypothetical protein
MLSRRSTRRGNVVIAMRLLPAGVALLVCVAACASPPAHLERRNAKSQPAAKEEGSNANDDVRR